ncbi:hypothetical protein JCM11641_002499 [Rhodosporidiobolus odoratus]
MATPARQSTFKRAFTTNWRNHQGRKNKSWERDGFLLIDGPTVTFSDENGGFLGSKPLKKPLEEGDELSFAQKDFRLDGEITLPEYFASISGESCASVGTPARATPAPALAGFLSRQSSSRAAQTPLPASRSASVAAPSPAGPGTPGSIGKKWTKVQEKMQKPFKPVMPASVKKPPKQEEEMEDDPLASPPRKGTNGKGKGKEKEVMQEEELENSPPASQEGVEPVAKKRKLNHPTLASRTSSSTSSAAGIPGQPRARLSAADHVMAKHLRPQNASTSSSSSSSNAAKDTPSRNASATSASALSDRPPSRPPSRPKPWDDPPPTRPKPWDEPSRPAAAPPPSSRGKEPESLFRRDQYPPGRGTESSPMRAVKPEEVDEGEGMGTGMDLDAAMFADVDELEQELGWGGAAGDQGDSGYFEATKSGEEDAEEEDEDGRVGRERRKSLMVKAKEGMPERVEKRRNEEGAVKEEETEDGSVDRGRDGVEGGKRFFSVRYYSLYLSPIVNLAHLLRARKRTIKKQPTWEGDGVLLVDEDGRKLQLQDLESADILGSARLPKTKAFNDGDLVEVGGYTVEVGSPVDEPSFGRAPAAVADPASKRAVAPFKAPAPAGSAYKPFAPPGPAKSTPLAAAVAARSVSPKAARAPPPSSMNASSSKPTAASVKSNSFFLPSASGSLTATPRLFGSAGERKDPKTAKPKFDPKGEGAVVMRRPDEEHGKTYNKKELPVVDVVIDPLIGDKLREHQKEGVRFLYECVMGMRTAGQGCILADDMGLGKTIQAIALIWTLLKQNPYYGERDGTIQRAMIVCPVTLVKNWQSEIKKWLGKDRLRVFAADAQHLVSTFAKSKNYDVLIVGYEKLRSCIDDIKYAQPPVGLIICDEGHRLKSANAKTTQALQTLTCQRRVILSGTPIQNNLGEFFAMMDFVNPGMLQDAAYFKRHFEQPIVASRQPNASTKQKEKGAEASELLNDMQRNFVMRRTNEVNLKHLPPKLEYSVFILPTQLEIELYQQVLSGSTVKALLEGRGRSDQLSLLTTLRKLANTPGLLIKQAQTEEGSASLGEELVDSLSRDCEPTDFALSGKLSALGALLQELRDTSEEKIVVISNFTKTLDIIETHCKKNKYPFCRLDGQTPQVDRIPMVNGFNKGSHKHNFVFLLSSKSGGTGLNIIGASRLVMLDADWNPSTDAQAMARIHREGQKRTCIIYRFFTSGTIDEKIFQRQLTKLALSSSIMGEEATDDGKKSGNTFSPEELRAIFTLHDDSACETHDLLGCRCHFGEFPSESDEEAGGSSDNESEEEKGFLPASQWQEGEAERKTQRRNLSVLRTWTHHNCSDEASIDKLEDQLLQALVYNRMAEAPASGHQLEPQGNGQLLLRGGQVGWVFGKKTG